MTEQTDVFVIGGGPAGLAAAIALRKKGFRVVVADGARWPIEKACGEGLMPDTLAALRELGVSIRATDGHVVRGIKFVGKQNEVEARFPAQLAVGLRRVTLHSRMVEAATNSGVELLWNTPVTGISSDGATLASGNAPVFVRARWIIGADGIGSRVRMWSGLEASAQRDRRFAVRRHYRMQPWNECVEIYWGNRAQAYVTPVGMNEISVVTISGDRAKSVELEDEFPQLAKRLRGAEITGHERGAVTMTRKLRHVHRGNVALVGDASGSVDAITGEGLALGFRQANAMA